MIAGVSGDLLSARLSRRAGGRAAGAGPAHGAGLDAGRRHGGGGAPPARLGPASAPRALLDVGARPLLDLLELRATRVECHPWGHAAVLVHAASRWPRSSAGRGAPRRLSAWRQALARHRRPPELPWALVFSRRHVTARGCDAAVVAPVLTFDLPVASRQPARAAGALDARQRSGAAREAPTARWPRPSRLGRSATTAVCAIARPWRPRGARHA